LQRVPSGSNAGYPGSDKRPVEEPMTSGIDQGEAQ
jgi:hypothetical protein